MVLKKKTFFEAAETYKEEILSVYSDISIKAWFYIEKGKPKLQIAMITKNIG